MNVWQYWRIRQNHNRRWALECKCGIAYWTDSSGRHDHAVHVGHRPVEVHA